MRWLICRCSNLCQEPSPVKPSRKWEEKYNCSTCRVVLYTHRTSHCKLKYHCAVCTLGMLYAHATVRIVLHWQKQSFKNWTTCANLSRPPRACALCSCLQLHDYLPFLFRGLGLAQSTKYTDFNVDPEPAFPSKLPAPTTSPGLCHGPLCEPCRKGRCINSLWHTPLHYLHSSQLLVVFIRSLEGQKVG